MNWLKTKKKVDKKKLDLGEWKEKTTKLKRYSSEKKEIKGMKDKGRRIGDKGRRRGDKGRFELRSKSGSIRGRFRDKRG